MATPIPKTLPASELITALAGRADDRKDTAFKFLDKLDDFRDRVSKEVQFINLLFPEYTPHDANYHLTRLFHVADKLLTAKRYADFKSAELFVLACALYGHDWGMAVSDVEKQYILTGNLPDHQKAADLWILPDEHAHFEEFAAKHKIASDPKLKFANISHHLWQAYVRNTHALRSGARARRYFESCGEGLPEAVARACEGHWLDFAQIRDENYFPPDFSVLGEPINLRAIAVYVRLIDLLDIADDRTPYIIWKFVAPSDPTSSMEWAKHRALQPVTFPPYQQGRIIQFDGSTDDHEVFAALEDLRAYCEEQLKECKDTLAHMNDSRHFLDIYHFSWRVVPRGFTIPCIRFGFDRQRMFEILSDQIYRGNPHVFLRELLQNSIDAIRLRQKALEKNDIPSSELGTIRVTVDHKPNGDIDVTWIDDGSGMDQYVVENFLAVAGKSYYSSKAFEEQNLPFDPISKFGIGILSCFMVAEKIEINTCRDPYIKSSDRLKITIPDVQKHFRIEKAPSAPPHGTTVKVFVKDEKLTSAREENPDFEFNATEYLTTIAGFVQYPIILTEQGKTTIILHPRAELPKRLQAEAKQKNAAIHKLQFELSPESQFEPQDVTTAKKHLVYQNLCIKKDLGLTGYEGAISYLIPGSKNVELGKNSLFVKSSEGYQKHKLRAQYRDFDAADGAIFRDGIFVAPHKNGKGYGNHPKFSVNLTSVLKAEIDVSRSALVKSSGLWEEMVNAALMEYVEKTFVSPAFAKPPKKRISALARACVQYQIDFDQLKSLSRPDWPFLVLMDGGDLQVRERRALVNHPIPVLPQELGDTIETLVAEHFFESQNGNALKISKLWKGGLALITENSFDEYPLFLKLMSQFGNSLLYQTSEQIRFLKGPWQAGPPLFQRIITTAARTVNEGNILREFISDPIRAKAAAAISIFRKNGFHYLFSFPSPFDQCLSYGSYVFNFDHPIVRQVLRLYAIEILARKNGELNAAQSGALTDVGRPFRWPSNSFITTFEFEDWQREAKAFQILLSEFGLISKSEAFIDMSKVKFVPGTFFEDETGPEDLESLIMSLSPNQEFGQVLA